jgi:hypothetical protein
MITMEFDDVKKIWDSQNNELLYAINEKALHKRILAKKQQTFHITNVTELLSIISCGSAGCFVFFMTYYNSGNIFLYLMSGWMFITALYFLVGRIRRMRGDTRFDRSMRGDLQHAVSVATYQVRISQLMRWNILPMGLLTLLGILGGGKSLWLAAAILIFFALVSYASRWEHNIYKNRKRELEALQNKLESEA